MTDPDIPTPTDPTPAPEPTPEPTPAPEPVEPDLPTEPTEPEPTDEPTEPSDLGTATSVYTGLNRTWAHPGCVAQLPPPATSHCGAAAVVMKTVNGVNTFYCEVHDPRVTEEPAEEPVAVEEPVATEEPIEEPAPA